MNAGISQDGTILNSGDIQPDDFLLPAFSVGDQGIFLNSSPSAGVVGAASEMSPPYSFTMTSQAGIAGAGMTFGPVQSSAQISVPSNSNPTIYAPIVITPDFGPSITSLTGVGGDPTTAAEVEAAINAAIDYYDTNWRSSVVAIPDNGTITNTVSISIRFDYGTVNVTPLTGDIVSTSQYGLSAIGDGHYGALNNALSGILPNLPSSDPTSNGLIIETNAQAQLLGVAAAVGGPAGYVGLNTIANGVTLNYNLANQSIAGQVGAVGAIEHEISEVFGRVADLGAIAPSTFTILDLYRFTGANTPTLISGTSDYFSINNGTAALGFFNDPTALNGGIVPQGGDTGDWASSVPADAFDAFLTTGTGGTISSLDTIVLHSIGLQLPCYAEGTHILTVQGEKRIETLAVGDQLHTLLGGSGRVIWLGRRAVDLTRHRKPWLARPVCIRAGAFAPGLPSRDLYLSPDHSIYDSGVLIPIRLLINGSSITQVKLDHVVYHHVELDQHDVIQAEGLPAESYLDVGDRTSFTSGPVAALHPEFGARRWEMAGCAPLILAGPMLEAARLRLAARAALTSEPRIAIAS